MAGEQYVGPPLAAPFVTGMTIAQAPAPVVQSMFPQDPGPDTPSSDYLAMIDYWNMVETILDGTEAMRRAGIRFLPQFPSESNPDYEYRRKNAMFSNIYRDIIEGLAAKPFAKETTLVEEGASATITTFIEDVDGEGNNLHVFAAKAFFQGINDAITWILVDKQPVPANASLRDERLMGARPYWLLIPAKRVLAVYSEIIDGKETLVHVRIHEPELIRDGFSERVVNRVRVLERARLGGGLFAPATYRLYEELPRSQNLPGKKEWRIIDEGPIAIGVIAMVPFIVGRRKMQTWQFVPPMQDAAFLQIEHYQQETNLKSIKEQAAFPMLAGNGVAPDNDAQGNPRPIKVGPKTVLYASTMGDGVAGSWTFIEPAGSSLTFLQSEVKATEDRMRELGRQPLTAQSGNLTVITTAFAASKGNSAVQAWALALKDALEQALVFTAQWMRDNEEGAEVNVHTDFAVELESEASLATLVGMRTSKDISRKALINEVKRRSILSPDYDEKEDMEEILKEQPAEPTPEEIAAAGGRGGRPPAK